MGNNYILDRMLIGFGVLNAAQLLLEVAYF